MHWFDIIVIIIFIISLLVGLKEGAVKHFFQLIGVIIAIPLAGLSYRLIAAIFSFLPRDNWQNFIGFFITYGIFTLILFLIFFIPRKIIGKIFKGGILLRILGGLFSLLGAMFSSVVFFLVIQAFPIWDSLVRWTTDSAIRSGLVDGFGFIQSMLPEVFRIIGTTV